MSNDIDNEVLFPEPSQLLVESLQKLTTPSTKIMGWGDKVLALDTSLEMLEGKHGYPDTTWRLEELIHVLVSASIFLV